MKRYSAGMRLRLAFAVAAVAQPPIVVVDEVLATGDVRFRQKCLGEMSELGEIGRTVVFVSHDLSAIAQLCPRTVWLEEGSVIEDGPTPEVLASYTRSSMSQKLRVDLPATPEGPVELRTVEVANVGGRNGNLASRSEPISIRVQFSLREELPRLDLSIYLVNSRGVMAIEHSYSDTGDPCLARSPGRYEAVLTIPPVLASGDYRLGVWMGAEDVTFLHGDIFTFRLWPGADDPEDWPHRVRVAQPEVQWSVGRHSPSGG
jgi:hypothetical protein